MSERARYEAQLAREKQQNERDLVKEKKKYKA
jgi:hypothetical protein